MPNNNRLRRVYNLKKRAKKAEDKAYDLGDGYHANEPGSTAKSDRKMFRNMDKSEKLYSKAKKLFDKEKEKSPLGYSAPVDVFAIMEEEERSPLGYVMDGAKVKDTSPNQGFSSKDFHLVQKLQGNYKEPSEGSFKTNSQNIYNSFDSPLEFRGFNKPAEINSGATAGRTAIAAADRLTQQNAQGLQNAATMVKMGTDVAGKVIQAVGMFSDRRLKKDIKLLGLSPAGLKIYSFKYKDNKYGKDIYQGVMSDEIPSYAVIKNTDGYDMVDYNKLDVEFKAI